MHSRLVAWWRKRIRRRNIKADYCHWEIVAPNIKGKESSVTVDSFQGMYCKKNKNLSPFRFVYKHVRRNIEYSKIWRVTNISSICLGRVSLRIKKICWDPSANIRGFSEAIRGPMAVATSGQAISLMAI